jgi:hypothetical protein
MVTLPQRRPERVETRFTTKLITANTKNTNNKIRPISIDIPAIPEAPKMNATIAKIKKAMAALNMGYLLVLSQYDPARI